MFGLIPRVLWSKTIQTDDSNRIELQHNCLLLTRIGKGDGPKHIVIETGTGDKLDAKMSKIFGLDGRTILTALLETNVTPEQIDAVIVTHLHFDHAGGLTRRCQDGESPDWSAPDTASSSGDELGVKLTFPNAKIIVQEREWLDAQAGDSVMTRTYYRDHLEPIADRIQLVDSPRPFPLGLHPHRDELPMTPIEYRMTEALPGIDVFLVPGHTWGQQAISFTDDQGQTVVFTPDVMPTVHHLGSAYSLAYDVEPYTSMLSRHWFLQAAADKNWLLVLDHEPGEPRQFVHHDDRGWFRLKQATQAP